MKPIACLLALVLFVEGCSPADAAPARPVPTPKATATAAIVLAALRLEPTPTLSGQGDAGIRASLADYEAAVGDDPSEAKTQAFVTLDNFADPQGPYPAAWWFEGDGKADIYEALAVILYTEGHTSYAVRQAVAARYVWYCGGAGTSCAGPALINFLSYFQPWREPWMARGFTSAHARAYLTLAQDVVQQRPGILTVMIPGADEFVHNPARLYTGSAIDWANTPFHFANVHPTWDAYLRQRLRRGSNGPARLWVLTMGDAGRACQSWMLCPDMTQPRK